MGSIKRRFFFVLAALSLALFAPLLHAQNTGIALGAEIQNLEKITTSGSSATGSQKYDALVRLARLRELSGDIEGAAASWASAASAEAGKTDAAALVQSACCLAFIGEWEKAGAALGRAIPALSSGETLLRARYLEACVKAWNSSDASALVSLAENSEFAGLKPSVYYTLWKIVAGKPIASPAWGTAETWKSRLIAEFPKSPEARIAAAETPGNGQTPSVITAKPGPLWIFLPGRAAVTVSDTIAAAPVPGASVAVPAQPPAASAVTVEAPSTGGSSAKALQTGLFSRDANAQAHSERLKSAGFSSAVSRRMVNGAEYWVVTVPPGQDVNKTIMELKNAGFESFPVF
jgi:hypothetical protein